MSGGQFDYQYERIRNLADDMERWLLEHTTNDTSEEHFSVPADIAYDIRLFVERLRVTAEAARAIEWYASGDHGEDTLRNLLTKFR